MGAIRETIAEGRQAARPRKQWVDNAKGLCILFIVVCHEILGLEHAGIMPTGPVWEFWNNFFYTFHVPVFFFVSGLLAEKSLEKCGFSSFLKTKLGLLAYPYVIWQTLQILVMLAARSTNHKVTPWSLLSFPVCPFMQFWFLYVLMLVLVTYALLKRAGLSTAAILAVSIGMLFLPKFAAWPPFHPLCKHMIYFSLGLALRDRIEALQRVRSSLLVAGALVCGLCLAAFVPVDIDSAFRVLPAILGGAATILSSFAIARWPYGQPLSLLGQRSLEIFVAHAIFAAGTRMILSKGLHTQDLAIHLILGGAASIVGPLLLVSAERLFPRARFSFFRMRVAANSNSVEKVNKCPAAPIVADALVSSWDPPTSPRQAATACADRAD
jgi:fucose 4-O-acetylase-like acetyltransferase